jgi:hypothetical protein
MKHMLIVLLATGALCGCSTMGDLKADGVKSVDFRAWVIETDTSLPFASLSPSVLFAGVSNKTAQLMFERHVAIIPDKETKLAEVEEVVHPTSCSLSATNRLGPADYMTMDVGTTMMVTLRHIPTTRVCSLDISCEFSTLLGAEAHHLVQTNNSTYSQSVPRFLMQTVYTSGPLEPAAVHLIGAATSIDGKRRHVLVQYNPKE